jgi:tetratricopeptide (TPR) repeat protein
MLFSFVADHFQYLASLGMIVLLVCIAATLFGGGWRLVAGASVPLMAFSMLTVVQTTMYQSPESLWMHTLSWNEPSWMPHGNLSKDLLSRGFALRAQGRESEAGPLINRGFNHLARAMELNPGLQADVIETDWMMHALLGAYFQRKDDLDLAIDHYRQFVSQIPDDVDVQVPMASALVARAGKHADEGEFEQAISLAAEAQQIYLNHGRQELAARVGQRLEAYRAGRAR